jgi:hypothetical protein
MASVLVAGSWRSAQGFPGYEVSDLGQVRKGDKLLKQSPFAGKKYLRVTLCRAGKWITKRVHHLVLEAFVGPCPPGYEARHLNDEQSDNRLSNLKWGTKRQNTDDREVNGKTLRGDRHGSSKINADVVAEIKAILSNGSHYGLNRQLAQRFQVPEDTISKIKLGKTWAHV